MDQKTDFIAPFAFYAFGRPELARLLLDGYGLKPIPETAGWVFPPIPRRGHLSLFHLL
ncbi:MAG: hypothetical protein ACM3X6_01665 [Patescibacteria group bacterium]